MTVNKKHIDYSICFFSAIHLCEGLNFCFKLINHKELFACF